MSIQLGVIADDYTGASDLANTLTRNGLRTVQTIGVPPLELPIGDEDAVVISLKIRSVLAAEAVSAAERAETWLRERGARHVLYKICSTFDSTDRGNIGPVMDALRARADAGIVLVTPAFPQTRRTVYLGHLFVGNQLLSDSPLKDHPLNPMHDANLVAVLARQSRHRVGLVDLATVAGGVSAVRLRLAALEAEGCGAAMIDAVFDRDLETIGSVALDAAVSIGASGLGLGLARALSTASRPAAEPRAASNLGVPVGGLCAIVAGSCSQATLEQLAVAERTMPVLRLDPDGLMAGADEVTAAIAWASERIGRGPVAIAASAPPATVARLQARYGREASGLAIEAATSTIAAELVSRGVRRLVVAGGETSGATVDRLGIAAFQVGPEISPGVPVLRAIGTDMLVALKSGNFGGSDFFVRALAIMQ